MKCSRLVLGGAILVAIVAGVVAVGRLGLFGSTRSGTLMLSGNVDIRQVDLGFRVPGRIGSIAFEEGAHVTAGAVLARLDAAPYQAAAAAAQAQVEVDKALLDKLHNGNRKEDIDQAAASLTEAQATREQARLDYERNSALVKNSAVSRQSFDQARAQYQVAQAREQAASAALTLMRAGARIEDIAAGEAQLQLALAQQQKAETDLADTTLRAPNAGTILVRAREPGATVAAGETVLTLTIDHPMRIRAYIDEPNLHRISPGMTVEVTADNNPKVYHGTIGFISPTAEFTPKTVQTQALRADLVFRLRVIVDHPDDALRQGAPVTVMVPNARPPGS